MEAVLAQDWADQKPLKEPVSDDVARYNALGEVFRAVYSVLHEKEASKIQHALTGLDRWLLEGR
jgi:hypothetical protein